VLDVTAGPDVGPPYYIPPPKQPFLEEAMAEPGKLRIAYTHTPFLSDFVHADCIAGLEATVQLCRELGHELVEAEPATDGHALATAFMVVTFGDTRANIDEAEVQQGRRATARDFEPATWVVSLLGETYTAADFAGAIRYLKGTGRQIGSFFEQYDILLTPTLALPPVVAGSLKPGLIETLAMKSLGRLNAGSLLRRFGRVDETAKEIFRFMPYTILANATGQPAMSVPLHWNPEGLPIGMQFMARFADEATLFRLARQLEQASPWANRLPPICNVSPS
jgi:amidase